MTTKKKTQPKHSAIRAAAPANLVSFEPFVAALKAQDKSARTLEGYADDLKQFAAWLTETRGETYRSLKEFVRAITPTDVREYRAHSLNVKKQAPSTINRRIIVLRLLTRWARREGLIESDPVNGIQLVKQVQSAPRWLDRKEQFALRRAAEKDGDIRNLAFVLLMLHTGLRVSEVAGLTLADVELGERKGQITVRGKGTKVRTIPLNAEIRHALRDYLAKRPQADHDALFVGQKGEPLGKKGIEYQIAVIARLANLEHCSPHTLRHTFAKNLIDSGVSIDQVATLLGHRNLTTTARYTKPSQQDLARAVEKLEEK